MTAYGYYNLALAGVVALLVFGIFQRGQPRSQSWRCARIGLLLVACGYPWDFFAIRLGVWRYPHDPGWLIYGVPLNDLVFMWLCTFLATSYLTWDNLRYGRRKCEPESEHDSHQDGSEH